MTQEDLPQSPPQHECACKKTRCLKRYCDCFRDGVKCVAACRCVDCQNGRPADAPVVEGPKPRRNRPAHDKARDRMLRRVPLTLQDVDALDFEAARMYAVAMAVSKTSHTTRDAYRDACRTWFAGREEGDVFVPAKVDVFVPAKAPALNGSESASTRTDPQLGTMSSRKRPHAKVASSDVPLRTGQWTQAEIAFANQVMAHFYAGVLPNCDNGPTLRALLAELLHCSPMRISKKFAGDGAIGKRRFTRSGALADAARAELYRLEKAFHESIDGQQRWPLVPWHTLLLGRDEPARLGRHATMGDAAPVFDDGTARRRAASKPPATSAVTQQAAARTRLATSKSSTTLDAETTLLAGAAPTTEWHDASGGGQALALGQRVEAPAIAFGSAFAAGARRGAVYHGVVIERVTTPQYNGVDVDLADGVYYAVHWDEDGMTYPTAARFLSRVHERPHHLRSRARHRKRPHCIHEALGGGAVCVNLCDDGGVELKRIICVALSSMPASHVTAVLKEPQSRSLVAAERGTDRVAGGLVFRSTWSSDAATRDDICEVSFLAVDPAFRRRGIASQLVMRVKEIAGNATVCTHADNEVLDFWLGLGFEVKEPSAALEKFVYDYKNATFMVSKVSTAAPAKPAPVPDFARAPLAVAMDCEIRRDDGDDFEEPDDAWEPEGVRDAAARAADAAAARRAVLRPLAKWRAVHAKPVADAVSASASLDLWRPTHVCGRDKRFDAATADSLQARAVAGCLAHALSKALGSSEACAAVDPDSLKRLALNASALVRRASAWAVEDVRVVLGAAARASDLKTLVQLTTALRNEGPDALLTQNPRPRKYRRLEPTVAAAPPPKRRLAAPLEASPATAKASLAGMAAAAAAAAAALNPQRPETELKTPVVYVPAAHAVLEACARLRCVAGEQPDWHTTRFRSVFGFDVEWKVTFQSGVPRGKVATIQLTAGGVSYVFHISHLGGVPACLAALLSEPQFAFAGVGAKEDARKIVGDYPEAFSGEAINTIDLRDFADVMKVPGDRSLAALTLQTTGLVLPKPKVRTGDWDAVPLSAAQIDYAGRDACAAYEIANALAYLATEQQLAALGESMSSVRGAAVATTDAPPLIVRVLLQSGARAAPAPPSRPPANLAATRLRFISRAPRSSINPWSQEELADDGEIIKHGCPPTPCFSRPGPRVVPMRVQAAAVPPS